MKPDNEMGEDEISEELWRLMDEAFEANDAKLRSMPKVPKHQVEEYEPGAGLMTEFTRTVAFSGSADPEGQTSDPSEMDAKKEDVGSARGFDSFVDDWVRGLSCLELCKAKTTGELFPLPSDNLVCHPKFSNVDDRVRKVCWGLMKAPNHLYGCAPPVSLRVSENHVRVCMFLMEESKDFLSRVPVLKSLSWSEYLKVRTIDYKGDEVRTAQTTSWENIRSALPDEVGRVRLESVVTKGSLHYVENFGSYLLPEANRRHTRPPRVMIEDSQWEAMCCGLLEKGVCGLIGEDQVFRVEGKLLLNGLFGVPKDEDVNGVPVHRLIMNLIPLNRICRPMSGDISTLPAWPSMHPFEIGPEETLLVSSEDVRCFFYIFAVPQEWHRFLAFNKVVPPHLCPDRLQNYYLCGKVLPMGFCNSVSLAQQVHRTIVGEAVQECVAQGSRVSWEAEHRKDRSFSWSNPSFRVYLDNFDFLEKVDSRTADRIRGDTPTFVEALRNAYARLQVPRHPKKAVARSSKAEVQGAEVDGEHGSAAPKADKLSKYLHLCHLLLEKGRATQRQVQVVAGGFVYFATFRRPLLGSLNAVWKFVQSFEGGPFVQPLPAEVRVELSRFCLLVPLARMDFRLSLSSTVTASDASTYGGGVTASSGLTQVGTIAANMPTRGNVVELEDVPTVLTVGLFDGIAGLRVAADAVGFSVVGHVSVECHEPANRVVESRFPGTLFVKTVEEVSSDMVKSWACQFSQVSMVVLGAGPPCQGVSGLNADRKGALKDLRSCLFWHVERVKDLLCEHFPWAQVHRLMESVASMDVEDREVMSKSVGSTPYLIDAAGVTGCRRPRLYWPSWEILQTPGAQISSVTGEGWGQLTEVALSAAVDVEQFLEPGWTKCSDECFPTFTTSRPRASPGRKPAGLQHCTAEEVDRWQADSYRFPPYQYRTRFCLQDKDGNLRTPGVEEREVLMGFPRGYTYNCMSKAHRHGAAWRDERLSLLGNSWCVFVIAWLLSCLGVPRGLCPKMTIAQVMRQCCPGGGTLLQGFLLRPFMRPPRHHVQPQEDQLARKLTGLISGKGEDLLLQAPSEDVQRYHRLRMSIPAKLWKWRVICGWRWQGSPEHINVLELRAVLTALKWRFSKKAWLRTRFLHLVDSQVCLHALARGRSSSRKLRRTLLRIDALLLASGSHGVWTYVHTDQNPADAPSRRPVRKRWVK